MSSLKGFSLIELMVVIAIIAILASISVGYYMRHKATARWSEMTTVLDMLDLYAEKYYADHGSYMNETISCDNLNSSGAKACEALGGLKLPPGLKAKVVPYRCGDASSYVGVVESAFLRGRHQSHAFAWKFGPECENPQRIHCDVREISGCEEELPPSLR